MKKFKLHDQILVTGGKDKGKSGEIIKLFPLRDQVIVKGVNIYKRFRKAQGQQASQVIERERPLPTSKLMLVEDGHPIRVGLRRTKKGIFRVSKKTGKTL